MKKILVISFVTIFLATSVVCVLNIDVTTKQGINYQWHTIKLPLYLKLLDFFDRHYNYKHLVKLIIADAKTGNAKAMKILEWTYKNIKRVPEGLPIVDDHLWYTIVRGYGADDQFSHIFITLCNYAGIDAFYSWVISEDGVKRIPLSFTKINGRWFIFDPYNGVYFVDEKDNLVDIDFMGAKKSYSIKSLANKPDLDYTAFIKNICSIDKNQFSMQSIQAPINRLIFELNKSKRY